MSRFSSCTGSGRRRPSGRGCGGHSKSGASGVGRWPILRATAARIGSRSIASGSLPRGSRTSFGWSPQPLIVGHSLGAYVGLALASGWFGVRVRAVLGIGPKIAWPEADLKASRDLAVRPVRSYATEDEALARYRRVSGLDEQLAPGRETLARGVLHMPGGWRLAQDPATFAVAGAPFASLAVGRPSAGGTRSGRTRSHGVARGVARSCARGP